MKYTNGYPCEAVPKATILSLETLIDCKIESKPDIREELIKFIEKLQDNNSEIEGEFAKLIEENFWDLIEAPQQDKEEYCTCGKHSEWQEKGKCPSCGKQI